ncbi:hypothetical protein EDC96DRAFT_550663 [Choanephora cucurbitarum]|nr:hypothetical protein EDC96DRAFT_550663 [Choanephora cucurbitarum]
MNPNNISQSGDLSGISSNTFVFILAKIVYVLTKCQGFVRLPATTIKLRIDVSIFLTSVVRKVLLLVYFGCYDIRISMLCGNRDLDRTAVYLRIVCCLCTKTLKAKLFIDKRLRL